MSYIVPKDKPKSCKYCRFLDRITYECELSKEDYADFKEQYEHCPLIEVPTPHGRLIDADALNTYDVSPIYEFCVMGVTEEDIGLAETIIEAEGSENENHNV